MWTQRYQQNKQNLCHSRLEQAHTRRYRLPICQISNSCQLSPCQLQQVAKIFLSYSLYWMLANEVSGGFVVKVPKAIEI
jgi:hypothetical protein